jgi:quinoprotein glucose dehydrogenase
MVKGVVYSTGGSRRAVVALDAATGELLWMHSENEGARGAAAPRQLSGRVLAYWSDGASDDRILYVTPGYRLIALNARTGVPVASFGEKGVVDLKKDDDQGDGSRHRRDRIRLDADRRGTGSDRRRRAQDRRQSEEPAQRKGIRPRVRRPHRQAALIFHTIPLAGEFGRDTWEKDSASTPATPACGGRSLADEELGSVYLPVELPTGDYYGGHRPGNGLFGESLVAVDTRPASAAGTISWSITGSGLTSRARRSSSTLP